MTLSHLTAGASSGAPLRRSLHLACAALVLTTIAGCTSAGATDEAGPALTTALDPATLVPSVAPAPGRVPAARLDPVPTPGTVRLEDGAFTDRLGITALSLQAGTRVVGRVINTADVSELIVLQLQADFYDAAGRLIGSGTAAYADDEFRDTGASAVEVGTDGTFAVQVESQPPVVGAASAVLTVPQLVSE